MSILSENDLPFLPPVQFKITNFDSINYPDLLWIKTTSNERSLGKRLRK
jgi:hypothetical protein